MSRGDNGDPNPRPKSSGCTRRDLARPGPAVPGVPRTIGFFPRRGTEEPDSLQWLHAGWRRLVPGRAQRELGALRVLPAHEHLLRFVQRLAVRFPRGLILVVHLYLPARDRVVWRDTAVAQTGQ